jgi:hypothetical protein
MEDNFRGAKVRTSSRPLNKTPGNFPFAGLIHLMLPNAALHPTTRWPGIGAIRRIRQLALANPLRSRSSDSAHY